MKIQKLTLAALVAALITAACSGNANNKNEGTEGDSLCCTEADSVATETPDEAEAPAAAEDGLNADLFGKWEAGDGETNGFDMELCRKAQKDEEGNGMNYGYVRSVIYFEYGPLYLFRSLEPDGENIKAHYEVVEQILISGDPDSYDDDAPVYEERRSTGTLTIKPAGDGKLKVDVKDDGIKPYTAHKIG